MLLCVEVGRPEFKTHYGYVKIHYGYHEKGLTLTKVMSKFVMVMSISPTNNECISDEKGRVNVSRAM